MEPKDEMELETEMEPENEMEPDNEMEPENEKEPENEVEPEDSSSVDEDDPNRPFPVPTDFPARSDFTLEENVGPFNWPHPDDLEIPHPEKELSFTREEYYSKFNIVTRYEYCILAAKKKNEEEWDQLNGSAKKDAIIVVWKGLKNDPLPRRNKGKPLFESYTRSKHPEGAAQQLYKWMREYYGKDNVSKPDESTSFPGSFEEAFPDVEL